MAASIDRTPAGTAFSASQLVGAALVGPLGRDVPGLASDRVSRLYAEEERRERVARTDLMIAKAETQLH